jgi:glycosyltransferase involved in cell wall biosynthesis
LPNSQSEYNRLKKDFPCAGSYSIIPNAVDTAVFKFNEKVSRCDDKVLCVARFEPKKNQLNLIKALSNTPYQLTLAGNIAPNHTAYYKRCKKEAGPNVTFLESPPQEKIVSLYQSHKVHVLASWFETTGLSTLEAAACGSNIVITNKGDTVEYFGTNACYCDPDSPESIKAAIDQAAEQPVNKVFMERIKRNYNWMLTAHKTLAAYQQFLDR